MLQKLRQKGGKAREHSSSQVSQQDDLKNPNFVKELHNHNSDKMEGQDFPPKQGNILNYREKKSNSYTLSVPDTAVPPLPERYYLKDEEFVRKLEAKSSYVPHPITPELPRRAYLEDKQFVQKLNAELFPELIQSDGTLTAPEIPTHRPQQQESSLDLQEELPPKVPERRISKEESPKETSLYEPLRLQMDPLESTYMSLQATKEKDTQETYMSLSSANKNQDQYMALSDATRLRNIGKHSLKQTTAPKLPPRGLENDTKDQTFR